MQIPKRIVIFASGNGSNAGRIVNYFKETQHAEVCLILSNNPRARVLERAKNLKIPAISFNKEVLYNTPYIDELLKSIDPELIVLAGFLWLLPKSILDAFPGRVINIHPALLPNFGGKGMYGKKVHEAVIAAAKRESGITIHYVTPEYDKGNIIFQAKTKINSRDTVEKLAEKIHKLEHEHFPKVIEELLKDSH